MKGWDSVEKPTLLNLNEIQQVYLELLGEFDAVCRHHGLRYDLCGGSMLGAVRHKGYIPWDNDIDLSMPRPDYERLLALKLEGKLQMSAHRDLVSDRDETFPRHFARFVRHDVKRVADMAEEWDCPYIGIDIFPLDAVPDNPAEQGVQRRRLVRWNRLLAASVRYAGSPHACKARLQTCDL